METFQHTLSTMQADQQRNTWMAERYTCDGLASHDPFYHEYPEVIAMVIERVKYGISIGLRTVEVMPWTNLFQSPLSAGAVTQAETSRQVGKAHAGPLRASFRYTASGAVIEYTCLASDDNERPCALHVRVHLPRLSGMRLFRVGGFEPTQALAVEVRATGPTDEGSRGGGGEHSTATASADGVVEVSAPTGAGWALDLQPL